MEINNFLRKFGMTFLSVMGLWFFTYCLSRNITFGNMMAALFSGIGVTICICWNELFPDKKEEEKDNEDTN